MPQNEEMPEGLPLPGTEDTVLGSLIGYRLKRAYMQIQPLAQQALAEDDLRVVSFSSLSVIVDNPGIVQSELAGALRMERSNIVVIIDELEQRGLITRKKVPTDRRRYALTATLRGRRLRDRAVERVTLAEEHIVGQLDKEDRAHLLAILDRLSEPRGT